MNDFFIKEIRASGKGVEDSWVVFKPGVNIIHGASNTGKTHVIMCIDYMLGSDTPPMAMTTGIDTITMTLENPDGEIFCARRKILDEKEGSKADSVISIHTTFDYIEDGIWRIKDKAGKPSYNSTILPCLLGVSGPIQIISTQQQKKQQFTFRTFLHQLFLREEYIFTSGTIIDNPKHSTITLSINALSFLLTGKADDGEQIDTPEMRKAKKGAVVKYIRRVMENYEHRKAELQEELEKTGDADVENRMEAIVSEIAEVDAKMSETNQRIRDLQVSIAEEAEELEEASLLQDRYRMLRSQYKADIERLVFITEGEERGTHDHVDTCPFCDHEITKTEDRKSYVESARAELEKTKLRLEDLANAENETIGFITELETSISSLKEQRAGLTTLVNREYKPKSLELHDALHSFRRIVELRQEIELMGSQIAALNQDIDDTENEDETQDKYDAKERFDEILFTHLSEAVSKAISECAYPGFKTAWLSKKSFDIMVNGKPKKNEGKGYRAYLNSIYAFTLMKFIETNGVYAPRLLILDSPSLSLAESPEVRIDSSMKASLFNYILKHCGGCQVIIAENDIPDGVDYSQANLIHFTMSNEGRYGFLEHVRNGDMLDVSDEEGEDA